MKGNKIFFRFLGILKDSMFTERIHDSKMTKHFRKRRAPAWKVSQRPGGLDNVEREKEVKTGVVKRRIGVYVTELRLRSRSLLWDTGPNHHSVQNLERSCVVDCGSQTEYVPRGESPVRQPFCDMIERSEKAKRFPHGEKTQSLLKGHAQV